MAVGIGILAIMSLEIFLPKNNHYTIFRKKLKVFHAQVASP
jgi:hypothetical protein